MSILNVITAAAGSSSFATANGNSEEIEAELIDPSTRPHAPQV
jgi:hypothetical protein